MTAARREIIDPVHGFIQTDHTEVRIIDDPVFQRLRRINQLSGAHLVYPGARHARFEHSLGAMHIAGMAGASLRERGFVGESQARALRLAGLVHDIGHGPFSHLFEPVMRRHGGLGGVDHERIGRRILEETSLGDPLGRDRRRVADLAYGSRRRSALSDVVSGIMGADTMDYLLRDGHFTGSEHARVDHRRIVQSVEIHDNAIALARSALHSFESMMHSRRQMFHTVYFHRAVRAAQTMVRESFDLAASALGLDSLSLDEYVGLTDESIMSQIAGLEGTPDVRAAQRLADEYHRRRLPKCVLDVELTGRRPDRARLRSRIARRAGVAESEVLVDITGASSLPLSSDGRALRSISLVSGTGRSRRAERVPFSKLPLIAALLVPISMLRVYARSNTKKVAAAAASVSV